MGRRCPHVELSQYKQFRYSAIWNNKNQTKFYKHFLLPQPIICISLFSYSLFCCFETFVFPYKTVNSGVKNLYRRPVALIQSVSNFFVRAKVQSKKFRAKTDSDLLQITFLFTIALFYSILRVIIKKYDKKTWFSVRGKIKTSDLYQRPSSFLISFNHLFIFTACRYLVCENIARFLSKQWSYANYKKRSIIFFG